MPSALLTECSNLLADYTEFMTQDPPWSPPGRARDIRLRIGAIAGMRAETWAELRAKASLCRLIGNMGLLESLAEDIGAAPEEGPPGAA